MTTRTKVEGQALPLNAKAFALLSESQKKEIATDILPLIFHKMKNRLTPIIGFSQVLRQKTGDEVIADRLEKIERNARELTDQLNTLVDYFQGGEPTRAAGSINQAVDRLRPQLEEIGGNERIAVTVELDPAIADHPVIPHQLDILVAVLSENALTALQLKNQPGKTLLMKTIAQEIGSRLIVRDNGIGIRPEDIHNIWLPFYSTFPGGFGLGLTIAEKIIALHGGQARIDSADGEYFQMEVDIPYRIENK